MTKALRLFDADRLRWLDEAAALGPLVALRMGPVKTWVVTDPELARTMLVTESASWTRPPATLAPIRVGVGQNLFTQSDKEWATVQPFVAPAFRRKALESRLADLDALIQDEVESIPRDTDTDLDRVMGRIALKLAAWILLGQELESSRADEIAHHQHFAFAAASAVDSRRAGKAPRRRPKRRTGGANGRTARRRHGRRCGAHA